MLQIYAQLLDEGTYLCSVSTMYRVLRKHAQVNEHRRRARHPAKACPELVATAPRQVYSWDITKLAGPVKGQYFDAYVMIDIYSRYIVGVHVHTHESGVLATELVKEIFGCPRHPAGRARRPGHLDDLQIRRRAARRSRGDPLTFPASGVE